MSNYKYNADGYAEGIEYTKNENGSINWRNMIPAEHFVVNHKMKSRLEKKYQKPFDQIKVSECTDKEILILISGIKAVASLRGYSAKIDYIAASTGTHAAVTCHITWFPNTETNMVAVTFGDSARACVNTTEGDFQFHLEAIASNRAFIRAVRNFLNISIVGKDEIGDVKEMIQERENNQESIDVSTQDDPNQSLPAELDSKPPLDKDKIKQYSYLEELLKSSGMTFESFKSRAIEKHSKKLKSDPTTWTGINETIPQRDVFHLTELLAKSLKALPSS